MKFHVTCFFLDNILYVHYHISKILCNLFLDLVSIFYGNSCEMSRKIFSEEVF
jgi:hypothetical protein